MNRSHWLFLLAGLMVGLVISGGFILRAQDHPPRVQSQVPPKSAEQPAIANPAVLPELTGPESARQAEPPKRESTPLMSLQDALLRPFRFPFARPTSLQQVCIHLKQTLKATVVLDKAALDRQNVKPEDTVQLELEGTRLKTGLKLLLDQVRLTFHIVPEDNLMIITDREGSDDPTARIWSELQALHRDLHDLQDAVDELRDFLGDSDDEGLHVRTPTIIEEKPEHGAEKPGTRLDKPGSPRQKPDAPRSPQSRPRPSAPRVPLSFPLHRR
jgi:hypothetical protein